MESLTTLVPSHLHPELPPPENPVCEGCVVRYDDDEGGWGVRCKLKQSWMNDAPERSSRPTSTDPREEDALGYMNEARFISYKSHHGDDHLLEKTNMGQNIYGLVTDCIDDIWSYIQM